MSDEPQTGKRPPIVVNDGGQEPPSNGTPPQPQQAAPPPPADPRPAPGEWVELAAVQELLDELSKKQAVMVGIATAAAMVALIVAIRAQSAAKAALRATPPGSLAEP